MCRSDVRAAGQPSPSGVLSKEENMSNFKDRTVGNNFKVVYNGEVYSAQIDRSNSSMHENTTDEEGNTVVKKLNAANLNAAFAEKQDRLIAGQGIEIEGNTVNTSHTFQYDSLVLPLNDTTVYAVNNQAWEMTYKSDSIAKGGFYIKKLSEGKNCSAEFELENMHFTAADSDPTVAVKFVGNQTIHCLFRLKKSAARIVNNSWKTVGSITGVGALMPVVQGNDSVKVRVVRIDQGNGKDVFSFFFNGNKIGEIEMDLLGYSTVSIGTVGCKADKIKHWRFEHIG